MASLIDSVMQTSGTPQNIAFSGTVGESTAITGQGPFAIVRLVASSDCFWLASAAGTDATSSNGEFLPSGVVEYKKINTGDIISVVQSTASGTLYITQQV